MAYGRVMVDYRPEKTDPYRTRITVGRDRVKYPGYCGTPTVDLTTVNILLNSIVLTLNEKFITIDVKDFYLNTPMDRSECMRLKPIPHPPRAWCSTTILRLRPPGMGICMCRLSGGCMVSRKQVSLCSNF